MSFHGMFGGVRDSIAYGAAGSTTVLHALWPARKVSKHARAARRNGLKTRTSCFTRAQGCNQTTCPLRCCDVHQFRDMSFPGLFVFPTIHHANRANEALKNLALAAPAVASAFATWTGRRPSVPFKSKQFLYCQEQTGVPLQRQATYWPARRQRQQPSIERARRRGGESNGQHSGGKLGRRRRWRWRRTHL